MAKPKLSGLKPIPSLPKIPSISGKAHIVTIKAMKKLGTK
jgi:hypothetical protein